MRSFLVILCMLVAFPALASSPNQAPMPPQAPSVKVCECDVTGVCDCSPGCQCKPATVYVAAVASSYETMQAAAVKASRPLIVGVNCQPPMQEGSFSVQISNSEPAYVAYAVPKGGELAVVKTYTPDGKLVWPQPAQAPQAAPVYYAAPMCAGGSCGAGGCGGGAGYAPMRGGFRSGMGGGCPGGVCP